MLRKAANMSHFGSDTSLTRAAGKPAMLLAAAMAAVLGSCAKQHSEQEANAALPPPPAYCEPRSTPDCEFKGSMLRTVDPAEFARLKLAYERRCIRHAEKAERERMRELHASGACTDRSAPSLAASR
jgi:hypothetical protein